MQITIATFNLENLFTRPTAMSGADDDAGRQAIEDHAVANAIADKPVYSDADKATLIALSQRYGWHLRNPPSNSLLFLQKIRGRLFSNTQAQGLQVVAKGRADWTGWFELRRSDVRWEATFNTARVIDAQKPDILCIVEVENRPTLKHFNEQVLEAKFGWSFPHFMVLDGNDDRGIDVGLASKFPIETMRSHVDDGIEDGPPTFSRDCPEYDLLLPGGGRLVVIPNHFKSKRNGDDLTSRKKREKQAKRASAIALAALARTELVLIAGDFNDVPTSQPISNIFAGGFVDVKDHPDYPTDRPGTFGTGLAGNKIDYLVMSPALRQRLVTTGVERRGSFHPNLWQSFDTVTGASTEASDHHMVWAKFEI